MSHSRFPKLLEPIMFGTLELSNRMIFGPHETRLESDLEAYGAYMGARARSGVGAIITTIVSVHESGYMGRGLPRLHSDGDITTIARLVAAAKQHDAKLFLQMGHLGVQVGPFDVAGLRSPRWGASAARVQTPARNVAALAMPVDMIEEVIVAHGAAARRAREAGADGIELYASHDGLIGSFLAESVNRRDDAYGGNFVRRFRLLKDIISAIRAAVGRDFPVGMRLSGDDLDNVGLTPAEAPLIAREIDLLGLIDYLHIAQGGEGTRRGIIGAIPPMSYPEGAGSANSHAIKPHVTMPVIANGRINQPQTAEAILASGKADAVCLVRPLICDSDYVAKVRTGRVDEIRACIACNQACVGHLAIGGSVNCIQSPVSGRESLYPAEPEKAAESRRVLVVGGGVAGMRAAIEAANRGHQVRLCEASPRLGGQVLLAQMLPAREECGSVVTNLSAELQRSAVEVKLNEPVDAAYLQSYAADAVIVATGGRPTLPDLIEDASVQIATAWAVINGDAPVGRKVVVVDLVGDWVAPGVAELLASKGHEVVVATLYPRLGEAISFGGDEAGGRMALCEIPIIPYARIVGLAERTIYFEHIMALTPITIDDVDTIAISAGAEPNLSFMTNCEALTCAPTLVGDCKSPRTIEEAIFEGFEAGRAT